MLHLRRSIILLVFVGGLALSSAFAVDPVAAKNAAVVVPPAKSRWSFSAGATVRSVDVNFHTKAPGPISTGALFHARGPGGPGDVGLIHSKGDVVQYDDGIAGPDDFALGGGFGGVGTGDASFSINSLDQFTGATGFIHNKAYVPGEVRFHSHGTTYNYASSYSGRDLNASDSEAGVGPSLNLRYIAWQKGDMELGVNIGWAFVQTSHHSGRQVTARQSVAEIKHDTSYAYAYDFGDTAVNNNLGAGPPFNVNNITKVGIVYDAAVYNTFPAFLQNGVKASDPRSSQSTKNSLRQVLEIEAVSSSSLRLDLNVIPLLVDFTFHPCSRATVGIAVGPTINVLGHDFNARTDWTANGRRVASKSVHDSGADVKVGLSTQLVTTVNLCRSGKWFLEVAGGYDWVGAQDVSVGGASAKIDVSSWNGQLGIGIRL